MKIPIICISVTSILEWKNSIIKGVLQRSIFTTSTKPLLLSYPLSHAVFCSTEQKAQEYFTQAQYRSVHTVQYRTVANLKWQKETIMRKGSFISQNYKLPIDRLCDVTLSAYPHRAGLKNMPGHGGIRTYDLCYPPWPGIFFKPARCGYALRVTSHKHLIHLSTLHQHSRFHAYRSFSCDVTAAMLVYWNKIILNIFFWKVYQHGRQLLCCFNP